LEEEGGHNLSGFAKNNGIDLFDALGLTWKVTRFDREWAPVIMQDPSDTFKSLAEDSRVTLAYDERNTWLIKSFDATGKPEFVDLAETPKQGCVYGIPNTVEITYGRALSHFDHGMVVVAMQDLERDFVSEHYVVHNNTIGGKDISGHTKGQINAFLGKENVAVWAHAGQGVHDESKGLYIGGLDLNYSVYNGALVGTWQAGYTGAHINPVHKLRHVVLYTCRAGKGKTGWASLVAKGGSLTLTDELVNSSLTPPWNGSPFATYTVTGP
jgi:hypothetical protein